MLTHSRGRLEQTIARLDSEGHGDLAAKLRRTVALKAQLLRSNVDTKTALWSASQPVCGVCRGDEEDEHWDTAHGNRSRSIAQHSTREPRAQF